LFAKGEAAKAIGGKWDHSIGDMYQLTGTRFQTKRQKEYSLQFDSYFTLVDGTYANQYGLTLIPWLTVCSLGFTHLIGMSTGLSENTVDVKAAGRLFGIAATNQNLETIVSTHCFIAIPNVVWKCLTINYHYNRIMKLLQKNILLQ
jgi:hypothetical protein